jgi:DNA-binding FrmR family transcriptional regulator
MEEKSMNYDAKAMNRLKRIEGQVRAVIRMMEEGKDCKDVITQLSAVRSGVDRTIGVIVAANLVECVRNAEGDDKKMDGLIEEAMTLLVKTR